MTPDSFSSTLKTRLFLLVSRLGRDSCELCRAIQLPSGLWRTDDAPEDKWEFESRFLSHRGSVKVVIFKGEL